jgi:ketosteroid isomerase-like protein
VRVRRLTLTAVLLLTSVPLAAQQAKASAAPPAATAEGTIRALLVQYDSAWRRKNVTAMGQLLAPTYLFFSSTAEVGNRSQSLADLGSVGFRMGRLKRSEISVRFTGPTLAVVSSRWETEGLYDGAAFKQDQRCGLVWVKTDGSWQIVSEHCIDIPVRRTWREAWDQAAADSARADSAARAAP